MAKRKHRGTKKSSLGAALQGRGCATGQRARGKAKPGRADAPVRDSDSVWIYGFHPVLAALSNPRRRCRRLLVAERSAHAKSAQWAAALAKQPSLPRQTVSRTEIETVLVPGAVHQGVALESAPLAGVPLDAVCADTGSLVLVALDQVTDPHNVGAVLRSCAVFGAAALITTARNAPHETGALAKAAAGALEQVPLVRVTNLARALQSFKDAGVWSIGLDGQADASLAGSIPGRDGTVRVVFVLGAEGAGLRRLTRETCDQLVSIPMAGPVGPRNAGGGETFGVDSLNVSNAAAVALYEAHRLLALERS